MWISDSDDTMSWFVPGRHGDHDVKFGAQYEFVRANSTAQDNANGTFVFRTDAFFNPADPRTVLCDDCLAPEGYGEIIGGSQREDDYDKLLARIKEENLPLDAYGWYLDLRKYGTFVHSGFGLGLERTVAWICGIPHLREAIAFPRLMNRLRP